MINRREFCNRIMVGGLVVVGLNITSRLPDAADDDGYIPVYVDNHYNEEYCQLSKYGNTLKQTDFSDLIKNPRTIYWCPLSPDGFNGRTNKERLKLYLRAKNPKDDIRHYKIFDQNGRMGIFTHNWTRWPDPIEKVNIDFGDRWDCFHRAKMDLLEKKFAV